MRVLLTLILSVSGLVVCGQKTLDCGSLALENEVWLIKKKPYTGECETKYKNGKLESESSFNNGLIHGMVKMYYPNGNLQETTEYQNGIAHGKVTYYFKNSTISEEGDLEKGTKTGEWVTYHPNGQIQTTEKYKNGNLDGKATSYTSKGKLEIEGFFKNGLQEGKWTFYNKKNGEVEGIMIYEKGVLKERYSSPIPDSLSESGKMNFVKEAKVIEIPQQDEGEEPVFVIVETMPLLSGSKDSKESQKKIREYITARINADKPSGQGTVYVSSVIDRSGEVRNVKLLRGVDPELNELAIKYVKEMPPWTPGEQRGKKVNVSYNIAVTF